jgi:hypothetical protein
LTEYGDISAPMMRYPSAGSLSAMGGPPMLLVDGLIACVIGR